MTYYELIEYLEQGHDIVGETDKGDYFGALNVDDDYLTIIIDYMKYKIPYGRLLEELDVYKLYKNMTFRELLDSEILIINEVY
jgi:hypothetical protein